MSEDEQKLLFQEFVGIKNEKTKGISWSGRVLSIVKKIVDSYNDEVSVSSKPMKELFFYHSF